MEKYYHNLEERGEETVTAIKEGKRPKLRRISLHLLSACSLNCTYCHTRKVKDKLTITKYSRKLNGGEDKRWELNPIVLERIDEAMDLGLQQLHIIGGEPTLVDNLSDLIERASRYKINTSLVTNGASLNTQSEKYQEELIASGLGTLTVSLDSPDEYINDEAVGVKGAHKTTVNFIKSVIEKRNQLRKTNDELPIYINTVVDNANLFHLPEHLSFLYDLGVTDVKLLIIKKDKKRRIEQTTYEKFRKKKLNDLIEFSEKCGFKMFSDDIKTLLGDKGHIMNRVIDGKYYLPFYTPCYLSLSEFSIVSNGDVYTCIYHFWDGQPGIGKNVLQNTLHDIWENYNPFNHNNRSICGSNCTRKVIKINKKMSVDLKSPKFRKYNLINLIKKSEEIPLTRLEIAITNKCTFACDYCTEITLKPATIGKEKMFNLVEQAHEFGTELISLTGGEPTVIHYLPELIRYIKDKGILCKVTTNGYGKNFNDGIFLKRMIEAGLDQITVSYYSAESELYSQITKRNDAKEKVEVFINKLQQLKLTGYDFFWNINIFVDNLNYKELPRKIKFLSQFDGIDRAIPLVVKRRNDRFLSRSDINIYYKSVLPEIESLELENMFPMIYRECRNLFGKSDEEKRRAEQGLYWVVDAKRCYHNFNSLFIANDGNAYHCFVFHIHEGDTLGNINELPLSEIWEKHQEIIKTLDPSINPICQTHRCNPDITAYNNKIHLELGYKDV